MRIEVSDLKKNRLDKKTAELGFTELEKMGIGKCIISKSANHVKLVSFVKNKIVKQTTQLKDFFKKHNVNLEKYIEQASSTPLEQDQSQLDSEVDEVHMDDSFSFLDSI